MVNEKIIERVVRLISEKGISETDFCKATGIPRSTFGNWKVRSTDPNAIYIDKIAKVLRVSERYILTGEEDKEEKEQYYLDPEAAALAQEIFDNPNLKILFDATRDVSKEDLEMVLQITQRLLKKK